ncbi:MAG: putative permease [Rhodothermales bacterium]|jgi:predicted permease
MQTATILSATANVAFVVLCGFVCHRRGLLSEAVEKSLFDLTIRVLLPCLIFSKVARNPALQDAANVVLPPIIGFVSCSLFIGLAYLIAQAHRVCGLRNRQCAPTFAVISGIQNYGFLPIPLITALYSPAIADGVLGVLFLHNVGIELAIWTVAVGLLSGGFEIKRMVNPPSVAIVIALGCNLSGIQQVLPGPIFGATDMLAGATIPMALLLVGGTISNEVAQSAELRERRTLRTIVIGSVLRLGIFPLILLAVASLPVSVELRRVLMVQAAMPAAMFPIILAKHYSGDAPTAVAVGLGTSVLALVTIPLWLHIGMRLLGN